MSSQIDVRTIQAQLALHGMALDSSGNIVMRPAGIRAPAPVQPPVVDPPPEPEPILNSSTTRQKEINDADNEILMRGRPRVFIAWVTERPKGSPGRCGFQLQETLEMTDGGYSIIYDGVRILLMRTPGINMTLSISKQAPGLVNEVITRAAKIYDEFDKYKSVGYWPIEAFIHLILRNGADLNTKRINNAKDGKVKKGRRRGKNAKQVAVAIDQPAPKAEVLDLMPAVVEPALGAEDKAAQYAEAHAARYAAEYAAQYAAAYAAYTAEGGGENSAEYDGEVAGEGFQEAAGEFTKEVAEGATEEAVEGVAEEFTEEVIVEDVEEGAKVAEEYVSDAEEEHAIVIEPFTDPDVSVAMADATQDVSVIMKSFTSLSVSADAEDNEDSGAFDILQTVPHPVLASTLAPARSITLAPPRASTLAPARVSSLAPARASSLAPARASSLAPAATSNQAPARASALGPVQAPPPHPVRGPPVPTPATALVTRQHPTRAPVTAPAPARVSTAPARAPRAPTAPARASSLAPSTLVSAPALAGKSTRMQPRVSLPSQPVGPAPSLGLPAQRAARPASLAPARVLAQAPPALVNPTSLARAPAPPTAPPTSAPKLTAPPAPIPNPTQSSVEAPADVDLVSALTPEVLAQLERLASLPESAHERLPLKFRELLARFPVASDHASTAAAAAAIIEPPAPAETTRRLRPKMKALPEPAGDNNNLADDISTSTLGLLAEQGKRKAMAKGAGKGKGGSASEGKTGQGAGTSGGKAKPGPNDILAKETNPDPLQAVRRTTRVTRKVAPGK